MKKHACISVTLMALALALSGCQGISSQADAEKAAAIIGLGPAAAQNGGTSATARTIEAVRSLGARDAAFVTNTSVTWDSPAGGSISFSAATSSEMPSTEQTGDAFSTNAKITYTSLIVKDADGVAYTVSGTAYARLGISLLGINIILTSDNIKISSSKITDTCDIDYTIAVTSTGYTCSGKINGYTVSNSFTIN